MNSPYVFMNYNELLFQTQNKRHDLPSATCLPFTKKVFITAVGDIMPCEKISYNYTLGQIVDGNININFDKIAKIYNKYYQKINSTCKKCANIKSCTCCFYSNGQLISPNASCKYFTTSETFAKLYAEVIEFLQKYPEAYNYIMSEYELIS